MSEVTNLFEMERQAQDRMRDGKPLEFKLVSLFKVTPAKWLDPYFGFILPEGFEGFITTQQCADAGLQGMWPEDDE